MPDPLFINYGGQPLRPQPYLIEGVTACGFALEGDGHKMQRLCDRTLNLSPDVRYRVVTSTVLFTFMAMQKLRPATAPGSQDGYFSERELNLTLMLVAEESTAIGFVPKRVVWYMPYIWVDSGMPLIAGREIYGYPKQLGAIAMPAGFGQAAQFVASGEVFQNFDPESPSRVRPIVKAQRVDGQPLEVAHTWNAVDEAARGFLREIVDADVGAILTGLTVAAAGHQHLLNLVFLRQLRSIADGNRACYQSVSEASFDLTRFGGAGLLQGDFDVEILKHASVPIADELGFEATDAFGNSRQRADVAYWSDFNFRLNNGRDIRVT